MTLILNRALNQRLYLMQVLCILLSPNFSQSLGPPVTLVPPPLRRCEKSPPMLTIDKSSTVWVAQDASPNVLRIDQTIEGDGAKTQIKIPFPTSQVK